MEEKNYFEVKLPEREISAFSSLALAHLGDCVYELLVRTWLVTGGTHTNRGLHRATVEHVCASAQSKAMETLLPLLTEEERAVYKRGRNSRVHSVPKNADVGAYHSATGLECLFGWLYLMGRRERINELFARSVAAEPDEKHSV